MQKRWLVNEYKSYSFSKLFFAPRSIGPVFANGTRDRGSGTWYLLLNIRHYKVRIKSSESIHENENCPPLHVSVVAIEKGAFKSPTFLYLYMTHLWCNCYRLKKCIRWPEFKSWTNLFGFYIPLGKGMTPTILSPAMGKKRQNKIFKSGIVTGIGEGKLWIQTL